MKVAQAKLKEIGPDDMNMEEYKVKSFLSTYKATNINSWGKTDNFVLSQTDLFPTLAHHTPQKTWISYLFLPSE